MTQGANELRFVGLAVKNFDSETAFFEKTWGLQRLPGTDDVAYFAAEGSDQPFLLRVRKADHNGMDVLGLAAASRSEIDDLYARLQADPEVKLICAPGTIPSPGGGYGFRLFDCDGHTLEIAADVVLKEPKTLTKGYSFPRGLSHIVMHTPDRAKTENWYVDKLGFRVSDWIGDFMSFLRCSPAHHRLALIPGPPALNHVAFDMLSVDEMLRGAARMRAADQQICWGPGRHTAGDNAFSYFCTPNGHAVEYTAGLEAVDEASWKPTRYDPSREVMDQWGIGEGGPERMPHPVPDPSIWQPITV